LVALLFEYKNISKETTGASLNFSVVFEEEIIDTLFSDVPRELAGKKLLPNAKSRGYVYVSVPKFFEMKDVLLYFDSFDAEYNDVYIAVTKP
jgi:hypothetical protein